MNQSHSPSRYPSQTSESQYESDILVDNLSQESESDCEVALPSRDFSRPPRLGGRRGRSMADGNIKR